jgi:LAS superfamily LD-carboxypeptidase LdcB
VKENRVRLKNYAALGPDDPRLVEVTSTTPQPQRLHWRAAEAFEAMRAEALEAGIDLRVVSGWRPQLWPTRAAYEADMIRQYGSVAEGKKWRAYESAHMTGLVLDFGSAGLAPKSATADAQKQTAAYAWLSANAERFGWTPYLREPWHWELHIPLEEFEQGARNRTPIYIALGAVGAAAASVAAWFFWR